MTTDAVSEPREMGSAWDAPASPAAFAGFRALLLRDLHVLRREWVAFLVGSLMQPLRLVFTYVLPKVGLAVGGADRAGLFSTSLVAGVVGLSMFSRDCRP